MGVDSNSDVVYSDSSLLESRYAAPFILNLGKLLLLYSAPPYDDHISLFDHSDLGTADAAPPTQVMSRSMDSGEPP